MRRHLRAAYAVALAVLGRPADADDVAQDAFIAALERIDDCRDPARFSGWLIKIVRNRALHALEANPAAVLAYGDLERMAADGQTRTIVHHDDAVQSAADGDLVDGFVTPLCCFWRREALVDLGPYDAALKIVADRDLWLRLASRRPRPQVAHIPGVIGTFREHEGSLSSGVRGMYRTIHDHATLWRRWAAAPEATAAMRTHARTLWQIALLDLATREVKTLHLAKAARSLRDLVGSGNGWWKPIASVPANLRRRRAAVE